MKAAVDAFVALIKADAPLAAFAGVAPGGALGPFFGVAPERTPKPYLVISVIPGTPLLRGFSSTYAEKVHVQVSHFHTTMETATANMEIFCNTLDTTASLTLAGGQICRKPLRTDPLRLIEEGIDENGKKVFQVVAEYKLTIQRTIGS